VAPCETAGEADDEVPPRATAGDADDEALCDTAGEADDEVPCDTAGDADDEALREVAGACEVEEPPEGVVVLAAGLGDAGEVVADARGDADPVVPPPLPEAVADGDVAPWVTFGEAWVLPALLCTLVDADAPEDWEKIGGIDPVGPVEQADTDAETRTVTVAQPAAVSLALLTFMRPPCVPSMRWL
jgi:hypothetical protein